MLTARTAGLCKIKDGKKHDKQMFYSLISLICACYLSFQILWGIIGVIITIGIIGYQYNEGINSADF